MGDTWGYILMTGSGMVGKSGRYMGVHLNDWVWYGGRSQGDT